MSVTPSFAGQRALVLHRPGETTDRLVRQLALLGLETIVRWAPLNAEAVPELVLVDADEGWTGLLPWTGPQKPVPLVALLGSEAPGRVAWALDQGADALIAKPIAPSSVYPALVMASRRHAEAVLVSERMAALEERVRLRPLVHRAVQALMVARTWSEDEAYRHIRREAMHQRLPLEQAAAGLLAGHRARAG